MENILEQIKATLLHSNITSADLPLTTIVIIITIIILTQLLRGLFYSLVIPRIKNFTNGTNTTLDNELVEILEQPLGWLIFLVGLWIVQLILAENIQPQVSNMLGKVLNLSAIVAVAYIIYRASPLLGEVLYKLALNTTTELDDLLIPYIPRLLRTVAIAVVLLKASEVFLGASIGALVGLLGGAGITFGLLLKEIIYDWFCTIVIYTDNIYRPGDWVIIEGIDSTIEVLEIGIRTTKLRLAKWDSIKKVPNSKMITGIVENWSQNPGHEQSFGINLTLKLDSISAAKTSKICDAIRNLPKSIDSLNDKCMVWLDGLAQNARVINIRVFNNNLDLYNYTCGELNLAILAILEKEGIDTLHVEFRTHISQFPINAPNQFAGIIDTVQ
ncbi:mechanosensitive ion channel family protein [Allocoleopsis franciscana]|uniref:Small-conductance mechanosensitive channel n=1 Tax=Allocoleopsis franciscana PCC 7113 TaxID=1173027 RepID=K9WM92_9CYAN|nr:mechanosensitive ion channel domain-containing protein [Allocoleopsis franciscana]AFZ21303.1 small-conductance mechanosensitive channel [Allocoleopsis franciscana PCC 7113]